MRQLFPCEDMRAEGCEFAKHVTPSVIPAFSVPRMCHLQLPLFQRSLIAF